MLRFKVTSKTYNRLVYIFAVRKTTALIFITTQNSTMFLVKIRKTINTVQTKLIGKLTYKAKLNFYYTK